jgi:hypothetical protein
MRATLLTLLLLAPVALAGSGFTPRQAGDYLGELRKAVEKVNAAHAARPGDETEADLAKELPKPLAKGLDRILDMDEGPDRTSALIEYARIAAEIDLAEDLARIEKALARDEAAALELGRYLSRDRFLLHATGVSKEFAESFARALEGVLDAYDRTFGFAEFSKVPGKKIRVLLHHEDRKAPPHFAPEFPYHSAIDFPVTEADAFRSPTRDGRFYFYGLCHELGHLIAMWGDRSGDSVPGGDHHAWAHYTGVVIVSACEKAPWAKDLRDARWRSFEKTLEEQKDRQPGTKSREEVLALFLALHELVGPKKIGEALNLMDETDMGSRVNRVRYYKLDDLEKALEKVVKKKSDRKRIAELFR